LNGQLAPVLISVCSVMVLVAGVYQVEALALSVGGLISVNMIAIRLVSTLCTVAPLVSRWKEFTRALAGLCAEGEAGQMKTGGGAGEGDGVRRGGFFAQAFFKGFDGGALGQEVGLQHGDDGGDVIFVNLLAGIMDVVVLHVYASACCIMVLSSSMLK
jgi:ATP-binding cassette subfamily B protein/ATP-binding cassette subfamily C protein LapB